MDVKSFDSKIGQITNLASTLISMLSNFPENSNEYKILKKRIDLLRYYQGSAIDSTKGDVFVPPPTKWNKRQKYIQITDDMDQAEIDEAIIENKQIAFDNRICANVKPYFFAYVYDREMKKYKEYKDKYNKISNLDFGKKLKDILEGKLLSEEELRLKRDYYKYMPLKRNKCTMNILASYIEDIEFDNKWNKNITEFDYRVLMGNKNFVPEKSILFKIKSELKDFFAAYKEITIFENQTEEILEDQYSYENMFEYLFESLDSNLHIILSNEYQLSDYVIYICYNYFKTYSKSVIWELFGDTIVSNIKKYSTSYCFPYQSDNGEEYLGKKYLIKEVAYNGAV